MDNLIDVRKLTNDQIAKMNDGVEMSNAMKSVREELGLLVDVRGSLAIWNEGRKIAKVGAIWSEDEDGDDDNHVWVKIGEHQLFGDFWLCVRRTYLLAMKDVLAERDLQKDVMP